MFDDVHEKKKLTRTPKARPDDDDSAWGRMLTNEKGLRGVGSTEAIHCRNWYDLVVESVRVIGARARRDHGFKRASLTRHPAECSA